MDWRGKAVAFYERACAEGLEAHPQVRAFVAAQGGDVAAGANPLAAAASGTAQWGVACSGGADSLALLLWLYGAAQAGAFGVAGKNAAGVPLAVADSVPAVCFNILHLNHNLRGDDSAGDAGFVASVAAALGWPLFTEMLPEPQGARSETETKRVTGGRSITPSEETLRKARQAFFARSGCTVVLQGHHLGDVAETLLMRLAAGSGLEGLSAPRPVSRIGVGQPVYLRPLLGWKKEEIVSLLSGLGIGWREDASNARGDYFRNRVRLNVLPALGKAAQGRDVVAAAALSRARLQEDAEALQAWLDSVWQQAYRADAGADACAVAGGPGATDGFAQGALSGAYVAALDWRLFAPLPRAIRRRALWRLLGLHGLAAGLGGAAVDAMLDALEVASGAERFSAGEGHFLCYCADSGALAVVGAAEIAECAGGPLAYAAQTVLPLVAGESLLLPDGATLCAQWVELNADLRSRIRRGEIPCEREVYLALPEHLAPPVSGAGSPSLGARLTPDERSGSASELPVSGAEGAHSWAKPTSGEACTLPLPLWVRFWRAGDRYRPLGAPGSRKVQDVFTDKKVPAALRGRLPLVTDAQGDAILWVAGLPPAHACAVGIGTKWALWLTYTPACKKLPDPIII